MALIEKSGLLKFKDAAGQMYVLYPVTTTDQVGGLDTELETLTRALASETARAQNAEQTNTTAAANAKTAADNAANAAAANAKALNGCWIKFSDENGNATDEPYIHWYEEA
ncbi:MAG: hypothetical protein IJ347_01180 [Faecalibacterium sp.]|nr:hypothetical protein [Faecalibacterium sp.]